MSGDSEQDGNEEFVEFEFGGLSCADQAAILGEWPNCEIADCPNKCCLHLNSPRCWPHTVGTTVNWSRGLHTKERERRHAELETKYLERRVAK